MAPKQLIRILLLIEFIEIKQMYFKSPKFIYKAILNRISII